MNRRALLKWLSGLIATGCSAVVAVPGMNYLIGTVRRGDSQAAVLQRVAPLRDLRPGQPVELPVLGKRTDAWTIHPEEMIGQVWLVRRSDEASPPAEAKIDAFSSICPHLGCAVRLNAQGNHFVCPCHKAAFDLSGAVLGGARLGYKNPSPRPLDALECRVVEDPVSKEWWVEVKYERFQQGLTRKVAHT